MLHDGEPEPRAARRLGTALVHAVEAFEYAVAVFFGDSYAGILHMQGTGLRADLDRTAFADTADPDLLDSVIDQKIRNAPELLEKEELAKKLSEKIQKLPEEQRFVIIEQCLNGQTFSSLSKKTGVSIETLSARKRYAIERLRKSLNTKDY